MSGSTSMAAIAAEAEIALRTSPLANRLPEAASLPGQEADAVLDCTLTERFGLRGAGTLDWLASAGITVPESVNSAEVLACGTAILRLGQQEVLLTAVPGRDGGRLRALRAAWKASGLQEKGYDAFREEGWAWLLICGPAAERLMPRISMADLRPQSLKPGQVAQTRALHQDAVVVRLDRFGSLSYELFFDIASAEFALDVLQDTARGLDADFAFAALGRKS